MTLAERFHARFAGLERAHGQYRELGSKTHKGKIKGQANTVRSPATVTLWDSHLEGTLGLGVVPIRDDGTCCFGAIDIDDYSGKLEDLSAAIIKLQLPLILCRSKSGGAHLFLFTSEPLPAELVRGKLMDWAVMLGYSGVEVFPKQTRLAGDNDFGNWINMPYYRSGDTERYALYDGKALGAEQFLDLADLIAVDREVLTEISAPTPDDFSDFWDNAPPCLQSLSLRGFGEGSRNNALFNICVYLRRRYGDDAWEAQVDVYNQKFMSPPLGHKEVSQIIRSARRKTYEYKCNDQPIASACNRQICLTRRFGIGTSDGDPGVVFGTLLKLDTEPPIWIWDVDGARLELTTSELKDQQRFHSRCIDELNKWPRLMKPKQWAELIRDKLQSVEVLEVPPDATQEGQAWAHLEMYCTGKQKARQREELLLNKPWTSEGRTFFSAIHFKQYLEQQRLRITERQLWAWLRNRSAQHHFFNIKGRGINVWSVPAFAEQSEDFSVPRIDDLEEM